MSKVPARRNALAQLILRRKAELDQSWVALGKRGGFSSHSILYAIATKPDHRSPPRPDTLARIAKAIDVPLSMVREAAGQAAGLVAVGPTTLEAAQDVQIVAAAMGRMNKADRTKLVRLAEAFAGEA